MAGGEQGSYRTDYSLAYGVGATCKIKELEIKARVISVAITQLGVQYECRYFTNSEQRTAYLFEEELSNG